MPFAPSASSGQAFAFCLLTESLSKFAFIQPPCSLKLSGFAAFPPRVIYLHIQENPALISLQTALVEHLKTDLNLVNSPGQKRPFKPHLTVAFRDLTPANFHKAWAKFQHNPLEFQFCSPQLTLLSHQGGRWHIHQEFNFGTSSPPS